MNEIAATKSFFHPEVLSDPFDFYREHTPSRPVYFDEPSKMWIVMGYDLVAEVTSRVEDFSNNFQAALSGNRAETPEVKAILEEGWPQVDTLLTADPPKHTRFRKLVNLAFSMPKVNRLEDHIREIADRLIGGFIDRGEVEFVSEYAIPLPIRMIAEQLGLERSDGPNIKRWTDAFVDRLGGMMDAEREKQTAREVVEFQHVITRLAEERRKQPQQDILSDLVNARVDGERPLDEAELLSIVQQLMVAGNETTTSSLAEGMALLAQNPDELTKVQADPSIIPNMVEEILRLASASSGIWRIATRDAELGGETIPAGAMVMLRYHAANRDPAKYEEPDRFIADRKNARTHLAFGKGIHMCVGNMLSRKEMTVTFQQLLPQITDLRLADGYAPAYPPNMMLRGLTRLPLTFERRT